MDSKPEFNALERAISLATEAHAGQTDKAGATYIRHPLRVMETMDTERGRIVAVLHDVVEDTSQDLTTIERAFDTDLRDAVDALTKREEERDDYMRFIERVSRNPIARRVKIADIEDNMDITRLDTVDEGVIENQRKYHEAWTYLKNASSGAGEH